MPPSTLTMSADKRRQYAVTVTTRGTAPAGGPGLRLKTTSFPLALH